MEISGCDKTSGLKLFIKCNLHSSFSHFRLLLHVIRCGEIASCSFIFAVDCYVGNSPYLCVGNMGYLNMVEMV